MTTSASDIQDAIIATLIKRYSMTVEAHGGRFTERELAMLLAKAPALLLGCLAFSSPMPFGETGWRVKMNWVIYVLGADTDFQDRATLSLDTVFDLLTWIPDQRWNLTGAHLPDPASLTAENLYTGHVNLLRVSVWAVTWAQTFFIQ